MKGFTLIELMVVLVILGVLAALAYPGYARQITKTRRIEAQVAMIEALQLEERHYAQHNTYVAFSKTQMPDEPRLKWWSGANAGASAYELDAQACPNRDISECVEVRARPGTANVDARFSEPECGTLTISSAGQHGASGQAEHCWP
jgi:type IV pilus assembly protein PilE